MCKRKKIVGNFFILNFAFCILLFTSCKVNYSMSGASIAPDIKTFHVKYFQKTAPLGPALLSQVFTEKLKDKFLTQTNLIISEKDPDLVFEGTIITYAITPLAIQADETASQNRLTIAVSVKFTNLKNEKQNFESSFSRFADYNSDLSLAAVENDLIVEINEQLTQDIFNKSFINW